MPQPLIETVEKYIPNLLAPDQLDNLIRKTERAKTEEMEKQQKILPDYNAAKQMFEDVKRIYDTHQEIIDGEQEILTTLIKLKTNNVGGRHMRVLKTVSNTLQEPKKKRPSFKWAKLVKEFLLEKNQFYAPLSLMQELIASKKELASIYITGSKSKDKTDANKVMWNVITQIGLFPQATNFRMHNKMIGLKEWFDGDTIKPEHLKDFIQTRV